MQGPELRVIFLGMDQKRDELLFSNVKGKNPFKDKRVRQAFYQAIDIEGIKRTVMRGASTPIAVMFPAQVNGFAPELNKRLPYDPEASKKLLAEAGYPNGFEVTMNCPNDRYVNDGADLPGGGRQPGASRREDQPRGRNQGHLLPEDPAPRHQLLHARLDLRHGRRAQRAVSDHVVAGRQADAASSTSVPTAIRRSTSSPRRSLSETDEKKRNDMIHEAIKIHQDDIGHIPLHQQALNWGVKKNIEMVQLPGDEMAWKYITVKSPQH